MESLVRTIYEYIDSGHCEGCHPDALNYICYRCSALELFREYQKHCALRGIPYEPYPRFLKFLREFFQYDSGRKEFTGLRIVKRIGPTPIGVKKKSTYPKATDHLDYLNK